MDRLKSHLFVSGCVLVGLCSHGWAAALPFGQVTTGTISSVAQSNSYTFSANSNDVVDFTVVTTSGKLSVDLKLYDPNGSQILEAYNSPGYGCTGAAVLEANNVKLSLTGSYTLLVKDCADTNTGNYTMFLQRVNNPAGVASFPFGQTQTGSIGSITQSNSYDFNANANDVLDFTVIATSGKLSVDLKLFDPTGSQILEAYNSPGYGCTGAQVLESNNVKLSLGGVYTLLVKDCTDTDTGGYTFFVQRVNNPAGVLPLTFGGQPQDGTISSITQSNSYNFSANQNDVVDFTVVTTSGSLSVDLKMFAPNGSQIVEAYNSPGYGCTGAPTLEANNTKLPSTGVYTVLMKDCADTNTGTYTLSAQCFPANDCQTPPPPPPSCTLASSSSLTFGDGGGSGTVNFTNSNPRAHGR